MLRECELKIAGNTKKKAGLFGMSGGGVGIMKLQSAAKKDPAGTLPLIEKELEKDPLNDQANDLLFDTCLKLELFESAAFALETVRKGNPENAKLLHKLAEFYLSRDQPMIASEVYNDIIKHHPTDGPAIKGSKDASARASMQKQKWDENADMRSLMKNTAEFEELEKARLLKNTIWIPITSPPSRISPISTSNSKIGTMLTRFSAGLTRSAMATWPSPPKRQR